MAAVHVMSRVPIDPAGNVYHFYVSGDIVADGLAAGVGSLATRIDVQGPILRKTDTGDTDWTEQSASELVGLSTNLKVIPSGDTVTVRENEQAVIFGSLEVAGTLVVDGEVSVSTLPA